MQRYNPFMGKPKEDIRQLLDQLPDDVTYEDVQYHIYVLQAVARGIEAADRGEVIDQEEVERRMARWLGKYLDGARVIEPRLTDDEVTAQINAVVDELNREGEDVLGYQVVFRAPW